MVAFLLLIVTWTIAEIFVLIKVAEAIGVPLTILLLIAGWPLGMWALRSQGRAAWRRFVIALNQGRAPGREAIDGALVLIGGTMLIIPGFISDTIGILALLPPTRALMRGLLARVARSRVGFQAAQFGRPSYDVDSTARDLDQPQLKG